MAKKKKGLHVTAKDWITVSITILAFMGGSGWYQYFQAVSKAEKERSRGVLEAFLLPLEAILEQNRRVHRNLTEAQELRNLEYAPDYLQNHFASLSDNDPRKYTWKILIEGMMKDNERAGRLIQENIGKIVRDDFREVCMDFVYHANSWESMWRAVMSSNPLPDSLKHRGLLLAQTFPSEMDRLLELEIIERRRQIE